MKITSKLSLAILFVTSLMGCSFLKFPGVHKIYIQQGHIITQDMLDQLEPGMTKSQVRFVLGDPLLDDKFSQDRWDYYYSLARGDTLLRERNVTVYFDGDSMTHYEGEPVTAKQSDAPLVPSNTGEDEETSQEPDEAVDATEGPPADEPLEQPGLEPPLPDNEI